MKDYIKRPRRKLKPFDPTKGPWLIWSHYHGCWHRRAADGTAAGYQTDIAKAGIFDEATARAYHDANQPARWVRDEAIPARRVVGVMKQRLAVLAAEADAFSVKMAGVLGALSAPREGGTAASPAHGSAQNHKQFQ